MLDRGLRRYEDGMGYGGLAPLRSLLLAAVLCALVWTVLLGLARGGGEWLAFQFVALMSPWMVFERFVAPLCLVPLAARLRPGGIVVLYLAAAAAWPLLSFWAAHPYEVGIRPSADRLHWLAAIPLLLYGGFLAGFARRRGQAGPAPSPMPAYVALLSGTVALAMAALMTSLVLRGGLFGLEFMAASAVLLTGALKLAILKGTAAGLALFVLTRGVRGPRAVAAYAGVAFVVGILPALRTETEAGWETAMLWSAGVATYGLAIVAARIPRPSPPPRKPWPVVTASDAPGPGTGVRLG